MKKRIDERQEQEIFKIEHYALWMMFWLLVASIPIQLLVFRDPMLIIGECVAVLIGSIFIIVAFVKKGSWGIYTTPSWKAYVLTGLLSSVSVLLLSLC